MSVSRTTEMLNLRRDNALETAKDDLLDLRRRLDEALEAIEAIENDAPFSHGALDLYGNALGAAAKSSAVALALAQAAATAHNIALKEAIA